MRLLLITNKRRWEPLPGEVIETPADAIVDLRTQGNELSVWAVPVDAAVPDRLLAAIAGNRDTLAKLDYVLLDETEVKKLVACEVVTSDGGLPDRTISETLHRDLRPLTARQILMLADHIFERRESMERCSESDVRARLLKSLKEGHIDQVHLNQKLRESLHRKGYLQE